MQLPEYIENISKRYALGSTTEYTFRGGLQQLPKSMFSSIAATDEPKRLLLV